jgi:hypothetical protein
MRRGRSAYVSYVTGVRALLAALTRDPELATRRQRWAGAALILLVGGIVFGASGR